MNGGSPFPHRTDPPGVVEDAQTPVDQRKIFDDGGGKERDYSDHGDFDIGDEKAIEQFNAIMGSPEANLERSETKTDGGKEYGIPAEGG
ncbi:MAG: hypothetical protein ABEJ72_11205, partial [Candidatus Aenigmatarchaeota archaeon]